MVKVERVKRAPKTLQNIYDKRLRKNRGKFIDHYFHHWWSDVVDEIIAEGAVKVTVLDREDVYLHGEWYTKIHMKVSE